jgi:hypothetical protein
MDVEGLNWKTIINGFGADSAKYENKNVFLELKGSNFYKNNMAYKFVCKRF